MSAGGARVQLSFFTGCKFKYKLRIASCTPYIEILHIFVIHIKWSVRLSIKLSFLQVELYITNNGNNSSIITKHICIFSVSCSHNVPKNMISYQRLKCDTVKCQHPFMGLLPSQMWLVVASVPLLPALLLVASGRCRVKVAALCRVALRLLLRRGGGGGGRVCVRSTHSFVFSQCTHGKAHSVLLTFDLYADTHPSLCIGPQTGQCVCRSTLVHSVGRRVFMKSGKR